MIKSISEMERNVWSILGLPFDIFNMDDVIDKIHYSANINTPCFISTPNLNFLIASQNNTDFKNSVINSDLSVADGKPLIWIARLLNIPLPERIAGSDIIEELIENNKENKPLKVFFFGGQDGVAEQACKKLNLSEKGLSCTGFYNPGFGTLEEMSALNIIGTINQSDADFVIVSLGAKKGQAWIEENKDKLNAPVVSHLGAVVNFIAGTVKRSPKIMQKLGFEWLWRIKEEPALWTRYFRDGLSFLYLFLCRVLPLSILIILKKPEKENRTGEIEITSSDGLTNIKLNGFWGIDNMQETNKAFIAVLELTDDIQINITGSSYIDGAFIAKTMLLKKNLAKDNRGLKIKSESRLVTNIFRYNCCDYLLN